MAGAGENEAGYLYAADPDTPRRFEKRAARPLAHAWATSPTKRMEFSRPALLDQTWRSPEG